MSDGEPPQPSRAGPAEVLAFTGRPGAARVAFDRAELREIFNIYGRMVAAGEWRDYAMDFLPERAVFSIFRRSSEMPLYRIVKDPALRNRQGAYAVVAATGLILKRGADLARVLRVLDKPLSVIKG